MKISIEETGMTHETCLPNRNLADSKLLSIKNFDGRIAIYFSGNDERKNYESNLQVAIAEGVLENLQAQLDFHRCSYQALLSMLDK